MRTFQKLYIICVLSMFTMRQHGVFFVIAQDTGEVIEEVIIQEEEIDAQEIIIREDTARKEIIPELVNDDAEEEIQDE